MFGMIAAVNLCVCVRRERRGNVAFGNIKMKA
jgi:hypothetical protein